MKYRYKSRFIRCKNISEANGQRKLQHGQGMTEYIIIVALIALASIAGVKFFGSAVQGSFAGMTAVLGGGWSIKYLKYKKCHSNSRYCKWLFG